MVAGPRRPRNDANGSRGAPATDRTADENIAYRTAEGVISSRTVLFRENEVLHVYRTADRRTVLFGENEVLRVYIHRIVLVGGTIPNMRL